MTYKTAQIIRRFKLMSHTMELWEWLCRDKTKGLHHKNNSSMLCRGDWPRC